MFKCCSGWQVVSIVASGRRLAGFFVSQSGPPEGVIGGITFYPTAINDVIIGTRFSIDTKDINIVTAQVGRIFGSLSVDYNGTADLNESVLPPGFVPSGSIAYTGQGPYFLFTGFPDGNSVGAELDYGNFELQIRNSLAPFATKQYLTSSNFQSFVLFFDDAPFGPFNAGSDVAGGGLSLDVTTFNPGNYNGSIYWIENSSGGLSSNKPNHQTYLDYFGNNPFIAPYGGLPSPGFNDSTAIGRGQAYPSSACALALISHPGQYSHLSGIGATQTGVHYSGKYLLVTYRMLMDGNAELESVVETMTVPGQKIVYIPVPTMLDLPVGHNPAYRGRAIYMIPDKTIATWNGSLYY